MGDRSTVDRRNPVDRHLPEAVLHAAGNTGESLAATGGAEMSEFYSAKDHLALLPALMLALFGSAILLLEFLFARGRNGSRWTLALALVGLGFTGQALWQQQQALVPGLTRIEALSGAVIVDGFSLFFNWVFLAASAFVLLISYRYFEIETEDHPEFYGLVLLAQCGMYFLAAGSDLITIFVALELMGVAFYVMVGFLRAQRRSNEAALKYFLLGGFSSAFLAYGFSLLYGLSGSTNLADIATAMAAHRWTEPFVLLAAGTTAAGLLFKIAAVPFHMWAPDAYEGAPTPVTAYLSVGSKAASFALLLRVFLIPLESVRSAWEPLIVGAAVLSMTVGNLAAITQTNLKRLIAYSSISHAGYILLGLVAGNKTGLEGIAVYILVYAFTNLGVLLVITALRRRESGGMEEDLADIAGLARRNPAYAALMLVFLLSLAGIPPTAGFLGKYYIFLALVESEHYALAALAALYVAVAIYYYFRIARAMYIDPPARPQLIASSAGLRVALAGTALATIVIGVYPEPFLRFTGMTLVR
jgi:NADH-quinone oxidoreductase subunit N